MVFTYRHTKYASYLGYITQAIVNNLPPLLFIVFRDEFGISLDKIGLLITINFGVQIVVDLLAAKYVDRIGYKASAVAAHFFCTAGLIGMGLFPIIFKDSYSGLITAVIINAIGGGLIEVLISPIIQALPGDEKDSAMSLLHSFYCWGHVGVVILSTLFFNIAGLKYWIYLPILWAVIPLANFFLFIKVPVKALIENEAPLPFRKLGKVKVFWLFFLLMICSGASEQGMSQWASLFAETGLKVSKNMGDLLGPCVFAFLMGISRTIYGVWGSRMDLKKTIAASSLLCVVSYLTAVISPIPLLSLFGCALCGFSVGIMWPGIFSLASQSYPQGGTAMFAILALAGDVGCSTGPGLVGLVSNSMGNLKNGLLAAVIFPVFMIVGIILLHQSKEKKDMV